MLKKMGMAFARGIAYALAFMTVFGFWQLFSTPGTEPDTKAEIRVDQQLNRGEQQLDRTEQNLDAYDAYLKRANEQLDRAERYYDRIEAIADKEEELLRRFDGVISGWERQNAKK